LGRIGAAAAVFGAAGLVLAYYRGYYDFSFLDRPSSLDEILNDPVNSNSNLPPFGFDIDLNGDSISKETEASPKETEADADRPHSSDNKEKPMSVLSVYDTSMLSDSLDGIPLVSGLTNYSMSDNGYRSEISLLAKMQFSFKLPTAFSLSEREGTTLRYVTTQEFGPYEARYYPVTEERPAVELYMGMILIDTGNVIVIVDADGTPLCSFDGSVYMPAYTRDKENRPLFKKEKEDGTLLYYYLSEDGKNFILSDYVDDRDGRGLYFDYPANWGMTENNTIYKEYNEETGLWAYRTEYAYVTDYRFTEAYDFTGGVACVSSNQNRNGMYFINEYGWPVQQTFVTYLSDLDRHFIWDYAMPASRGIESIGYFRYDHGLTRVRYQVIDYYNWTKGRVMVISDEEKLIRTDGSFYDLPPGYTLKGYSEGMILLEKDGLFGFMDYTGEWIAQPCYASATPFVDGLSVLETADGRFGMIDVNGNIVLPFTYDHITMASSGLVAVYREENGWSVLKIMEKADSRISE